MAAFLCRACGGALELVNGRALCRCPYCGTVQSVPLLDSEEKAELCRRAEQLRREFRYDKAMALYERLIRLSPTDADLYWALTLCRYGAELSPDGSVLLNRICAHSVLSDEDYKLALKFADDETRVIMKQQAEQIDIARRSGIELAGNAEYDVYLCAREADENGRRVMDAVIAAELYTRLCAEGFRVFFPQKSLEDKFGGEWEPYIYAALSSADVMVVVGTSAESFDEVWVRNAWSRFSKTIIPVVRDMSPSELPDELAKLQVLDMSRLGAENDLITAIKALTGKKSEASETADGNDPLIRRASLLLEDGNFKKADETAALLLSRSPDNAEAYVIKLLAEFGLPNENALDSTTDDFLNSENYRLAMLHGGEPLRHRLKEHSSRAMYAKFTARLNAAERSGNEREILASAAELETLGDFSNAAELAENARLKAADMREKRRSDLYERAVKTLAESNDVSELRSAEHCLRSLGDHNDAPALAEKCAARIAELTAAVSFSDDEKPKPRRKYLPFAAAGAGAVVLIAVAAVIVSANLTRKPAATSDITPRGEISENAPPNDEQAEKYAKACAELKDGNYSEAELLFTVLGNYMDSAKKLNECKYRSASALLESGEFDMAQRAFERLENYSNSGEMVLQCKYQKAQRLLENGDINSARALFNELNGKWESKNFIKQIDYIAAEKLLNSGDPEAAEKAFKALGSYSDSAERVKEARYKSAAKLMESGDYQAAAAEFAELGSYSDSRTQYCRAYYNIGLELAAQNKYPEAISALEEAESYSDAAQQMTKVRNKWIKYAYDTKYAYFEFGCYHNHSYNDSGKPIEWRVLTIENDMALVYAVSAIDYLQFDSADPECTWQNSSLRRWLNGSFYETFFTASERAQIRTSIFETASGNLNYIGTSGSGISDKIFLLNTEEAKKTPWVYGWLMKYMITIYAQEKLPQDYGTLFNWGRDKPLCPDSSVDATSFHCVSPAMWLYIGD